jgi:hypothetical protein
MLVAQAAQDALMAVLKMVVAEAVRQAQMETAGLGELTQAVQLQMVVVEEVTAVDMQVEMQAHLILVQAATTI